MNINLDNIAKDLYGKIQTRFTDIQIGDENAAVLSKREDIPKARFFEFEYTENGASLGTIAITLDETDGIVVQVSGDLVNDADGTTHHGAYKFIRSFRQFARDRLLNFDVDNIGKSNLDKRDYMFQAKRKEEPTMPAIMESKLYGTNKISYQDLGEARLIIKHTQAVNPDLPAGRTMHIESIYIENADGERFKYPYKHLAGARALAEHVKAAGNPYDSIGKHIVSLSEELAGLRKFKGYVMRQTQISEAMGSVTMRVAERIETIKKELNSLQRPAYYQQFAESFEEAEVVELPESVQNDLIDRLTIRTFNDDLKAVFPYIAKFVNENELPVVEINADDMLSELSKDTLKNYIQKGAYDAASKSYATGMDTGHKIGKGSIDNDAKEPGKDKRDKRLRGVFKATNKLAAKTESQLDELSPDTLKRYKKGINDKQSAWSIGIVDSDQVDKLKQHRDNEKKADVRLAYADKKKSKQESYDPEIQYENFMNDIIREDKDELFSPNKSAKLRAVEKLNQVLAKELPGGPQGINAIESLKGLIDDPDFIESVKELDPNLDIRPVLQQWLHDHPEKFSGNAAETLAMIHFGGEGETEEAPEVPAAPEAPPVPAAPEAPPAEAPPAPEAGGMPPIPPAPEAGGMPPAAPPAPMAESIVRALKKAHKAGATLETTLDFGYGIKTIAEIIDECGCDASDVGFEQPGESGIAAMEKFISGFWNTEENNFPQGGTRLKIKVKKAWEDGEFGDCSPQDVLAVFKKIDELDPSQHNDEQSHILKLAGLQQQHHAPEAEIEIRSMEEDPNNTPWNTDHLENAMKNIKLNFNGNEIDLANPDENQIKRIGGNIMQGVQQQVPNQNVQFPGGQMNPADMMKAIMQKINFGN